MQDCDVVDAQAVAAASSAAFVAFAASAAAVVELDLFVAVYFRQLEIHPFSMNTVAAAHIRNCYRFVEVAADAVEKQFSFRKNGKNYFDWH